MQLAIKLREHLVALPAVLGAYTPWLVVVASVHNAGVTFGGPLRHVICRLNHQDGRPRLGQLPRNGGANAAGADHDHVVRAIMLCSLRAAARTRAHSLVLAASAACSLGMIADEIEARGALLDVHPLPGHEGSPFPVHAVAVRHGRISAHGATAQL
eukprot:COSAG01_NODE_4780_length_4749_cov_2.137849_6_plen_156_part_00